MAPALGGGGGGRAGGALLARPPAYSSFLATGGGGGAPPPEVGALGGFGMLGKLGFARAGTGSLVVLGLFWTVGNKSEW